MFITNHIRTPRGRPIQSSAYRRAVEDGFGPGRTASSSSLVEVPRDRRDALLRHGARRLDEVHRTDALDLARRKLADFPGQRR